jgi:cytochrome c6
MTLPKKILLWKSTMKKLGVALATFLVAALTFLVTAPALAADLAHGAQVFDTNCAACHIGGGNVVNGAKTLKQADLDQYGMASIDAITTQVKNGKAAMPSFLGRLSEADIEDVAAYVLSQAENGW